MLHLFIFPQPGWRQISRRRKISSHNQSSEGALEAKVTWSILPPKACIRGDHLQALLLCQVMRDPVLLATLLNLGNSDNENILPEDGYDVHFYCHFLILFLPSGTI